MRLASGRAVTVEPLLLATPMRDVTPEPLRIPDVLPDEPDDEPEDEHEMTNEDFLEP